MKNLINFVVGMFRPIGRWYVHRTLRSKVNMQHKQLTRSLRNNDQIMAFEIVKAQARKPVMDILVDPITGEFYVTDLERADRDKHGANDQGLIINADSISVINGVYHYYVEMNNYAMAYLDRYLKKIINRKRRRLKAKMEAKIEKSLATILKKTTG